MQGTFGNAAILRMVGGGEGGMASAPAGGPLDIANQGFSGGGSAVPFQGEMESIFGQSFDGTSAFFGGAARESNEALGAKAYAMGDNIAFSEANPSRSTVAHELTHVVQNRGGGPLCKGEVSDPGSAHERQATRVEQAVAHGATDVCRLVSSPGASSQGTISRISEDDQKTPDWVKDAISSQLPAWWNVVSGAYNSFNPKGDDKQVADYWVSLAVNTGWALAGVFSPASLAWAAVFAVLSEVKSAGRPPEKKTETALATAKKQARDKLNAAYKTLVNKSDGMADKVFQQWKQEGAATQKALFGEKQSCGGQPQPSGFANTIENKKYVWGAVIGVGSLDNLQAVADKATQRLQQLWLDHGAVSAVGDREIVGILQYIQGTKETGVARLKGDSRLALVKGFSPVGSNSPLNMSYTFIRWIEAPDQQAAAIEKHKKVWKREVPTLIQRGGSLWEDIPVKEG